MTEEHIHHWPKYGSGCYCGATVQCAHEEREGHSGYQPYAKRCKAAALPGSKYCELHAQEAKMRFMGL